MRRDRTAIDFPCYQGQGEVTVLQINKQHPVILGCCFIVKHK